MAYERLLIVGIVGDKAYVRWEEDSDGTLNVPNRQKSSKLRKNSGGMTRIDIVNLVIDFIDNELPEKVSP